MGALSTFFAAPVRDVLAAMDRCLDAGIRGLMMIALGLIVGWWLYVPVHELMHAFACLATGGTISRLQIDPLYGGALLARLLPFVESGGDYAGRLVGFDTGGRDAVYLATDFGPYLLTLFPGVWAMRRAGERGAAFFFGFWLPVALAPFISLTGDAYEIGSIVVTWLPPWAGLEELRGDDVFRLMPELAELSDPPWGGAVLALLTGTLWAFATYALGRWLPEMVDRKQSHR